MQQIKNMSNEDLINQFTLMSGFDAAADIEAEDEELFEALRKEVVRRKLA